ncbi:NADPH-dependent FMN reductase [Phytomonospora sp. NPDC050363]|uniref:NADPH-dependent FMN reductase n=1 Tax=Phytomonospora sp. NPDC050363 TaxID=3155642 RepID=UPI0033DB33DF
MIRIAAIIGTTRPGRRSAGVVDWVKQAADAHLDGRDVSVEIVDVAEYRLPLLDEVYPAMWGRYENAHTQRWAETIASYDAFVFVTPEYNHAVPASLKNAVDFLFAEWNDKAAGFVSFGSSGGVRAVEHLRLVMSELKVATVRSQVGLSVFTDFEWTNPGSPDDLGVVKPGEHQLAALHSMLDELTAWAGALKSLRVSAVAA